MYKAIIIDDESLAREMIKKHLKEFDNIEMAEEFANGFDALKHLKKIDPDIIFLDIQMPKLTGFEMLELMDDPPVVIFVTAYDEYAIKAFEYNAVDYLLKPVSLERFNGAITKAIEKIDSGGKESIDQLKEFVEKTGESISRIVTKDGAKINIIDVNKINYIEAQDDYVKIHTADNKFMKKQTMKTLENKLPENDFIRIHRSYIVNVKNIEQIELFEKESYRVILKDGTKLSASKSGYDKLKKILGE